MRWRTTGIYAEPEIHWDGDAYVCGSPEVRAAVHAKQVPRAARLATRDAPIHPARRATRPYAIVHAKQVPRAKDLAIVNDTTVYIRVYLYFGSAYRTAFAAVHAKQVPRRLGGL